MVWGDKIEVTWILRSNDFVSGLKKIAQNSVSRNKRGEGVKSINIK